MGEYFWGHQRVFSISAPERRWVGQPLRGVEKSQKVFFQFFGIFELYWLNLVYVIINIQKFLNCFQNLKSYVLLRVLSTHDEKKLLNSLLVMNVMNEPEVINRKKPFPFCLIRSISTKYVS